MVGYYWTRLLLTGRGVGESGEIKNHQDTAQALHCLSLEIIPFTARRASVLEETNTLQTLLRLIQGCSV